VPNKVVIFRTTDRAGRAPGPTSRNAKPDRLGRAWASFPAKPENPERAWASFAAKPGNPGRAWALAKTPTKPENPGPGLPSGVYFTVHCGKLVVDAALPINTRALMCCWALRIVAVACNRNRK
jgi:hypothetical protein